MEYGDPFSLVGLFGFCSLGPVGRVLQLPGDAGGGGDPGVIIVSAPPVGTGGGDPDVIAIPANPVGVDPELRPRTGAIAPFDPFVGFTGAFVGGMLPGDL